MFGDCGPKLSFLRSSTPAARERSISSGDSVTYALTFVAVVCALHVAFRWLVSETAGIDDVDQILRAQIWAWGYGPQPPLYTWLTKLFLEGFGYSIVSMLLLKECILFALYSLVYLTARQVTSRVASGLLAMALLQANFSIAWEDHRELTHTVLTSAFSVATLYAFLLLRVRCWSRYFLFGLSCGLGTLSKYNFAFVLAALLLAAVSIPAMRQIVLNRQMLAALVLGLLVCAPHFMWVRTHHDLAFSSVHKLRLSETWDPANSAKGFWKLTLGILAHAGPVLLMGTLMSPRTFWAFRAVRNPTQQLLWRTLWMILLLVGASILWFRVTDFHDRYLQPLLAWLPVLLVASLPASTAERAFKALWPIAALSAVVIVFVASGRVLLTETLRKTEVLNSPFRKLAQDLSPSVQSVGCIIGENHQLAGNMRLWFPTKLVLDPEVGPLFTPTPRKALVIWNAEASTEPPKEMLGFARAFTQSTAIHARTEYQERLNYHRVKTMRIGAAFLEPELPSPSSTVITNSYDAAPERYSARN